MHKEIRFGNELESSLLEGINGLAKAVKSTLGPGGRNVLIRNHGSIPFLTKDGVTVARNIQFKDPVKHAGAELIRNVSVKTNEVAGDGTTTATILSQSIIQKGFEAYKSHDGLLNMVQVKEGIMEAMKVVMDKIGERAMDISSQEDLINVATISANGDSKIGELIGKAYDKVGKEGIISVEKSITEKTNVELVDGMRIDSGYLSHYFTSAATKKCELNKPKVLVYSGEISSTRSLEGVFKYSLGKGAPLVIVADDFSGNVVPELIANKIEAGLRICLIKSPRFGERRVDLMKDLAAVIGAKHISAETNFNLRNISETDLGTCDTFTSTFHHTTFTGGPSTPRLEKRINEVKFDLESAENNYEKEQFDKRIAALQGGIGVIYVGGHTELEVEEAKYRIEDALNATKSALEKGVVAGGGITLRDIQKEIVTEMGDNIAELMKHSSSNAVGFMILVDAIGTPFKTILENAGMLEAVNKDYKELSGYNVRTKKFTENVVKDGILDPAKVTLEAVHNAASISGMVLTTSCAMVDTDE
tara:strand:- start:475 stop:2070 length:1596 start_codon:yes stop_codon:yes gene_type:complete